MIRTKLTFFLFCSLLVIATGCKKQNENKVPVADAGPNQAITLPPNSLTLTGTGSDEDGDVVAYLWSQVSGPNFTTIVNPGSPSTEIRGFQQGTYIFQLMVTDNDGATGVDTTKVVVSPSPIQTLTLQPANNPTELILGVLNGANHTGTSPDMHICAWTVGGAPYTVRELLKFDLSTIPGSATIVSANLYLYSYPAPTLNGNFVDANFGTNNTLLVNQITSNWTPGTVGWYNQPTITNTNMVTVPHTNQSQQDLNLDVKNMLQSMVSGNANYGFYLKLQNEVTYTIRQFVSSYNTNYADKRPKLVVVYQP